MTPQPPVFELRDIRHRYGARTVLGIPRLSVSRGETLGIIGPSGAGKSTLLRLLQSRQPLVTNTPLGTFVRQLAARLRLTA